MDADKEGFLRSETSLVQTIGRAARNLNGKVILYADRETNSIKRAIFETNRRRKIQEEHNIANGIVPYSVSRKQEAEMVQSNFEVDLVEEVESALNGLEMPKDIFSCKKMINSLKSQMFDLAKKYQFEEAAKIRDQVFALEKLLLTF